MRARRGLQFNASYTYSKSLDETSQNGQGVVIQDSHNLFGDYGPSDYDARHRFVINFIYALPFQGNRLKDGWQLGSIIQTQTGKQGRTGLPGPGIGLPQARCSLGDIQIVGLRRRHQRGKLGIAKAIPPIPGGPERSIFPASLFKSWGNLARR